MKTDLFSQVFLPGFWLLQLMSVTQHINHLVHTEEEFRLALLKRTHYIRFYTHDHNLMLKIVKRPLRYRK